MNKSRTVILLIDAADPKLLNSFIVMGELPHFARLKKESVFAEQEAFGVDLEGKKYTVSLPIIASIFTSKTPAEHGMESHVFLPNGPDNYYPFRNLWVKPVWKILGEKNKTVGIVGTMGNYPVEKDVNGFIASSEYIIKKSVLPEIPWYMRWYAQYKYPDTDLIYPFKIKKEIDEMLLEDSKILEKFHSYNLKPDFPGHTKKMLIERWQKSIRGKRKQTALRVAIALHKLNKSAYLTFKYDAQINAVAKRLYRAYQPDFFLEYHPGIDFFSMLYNTHEYHSLPPRHNPVLNYYRFIDQRLGEIMADIDENTTFIVLSDHGIANRVPLRNFDTLIKLHDAMGIFFISGKNIKKNTIIPKTTVFDVTPTILYLMGLPVARDMRGRVITEAIDENYLKNNPVQHISTYEEAVPEDSDKIGLA